MRTTPRIGTKLWFGPKRAGGWGWSPVSVEGWLVTAVAIMMVIAPIPFLDDDAVAWWYWTLAGVSVVGILAISYLKGTSPGGRRAHEEYERARRRD
jgi:hypothetical protein